MPFFHSRLFLLEVLLVSLLAVIVRAEDVLRSTGSLGPISYPVRTHRRRANVMAHGGVRGRRARLGPVNRFYVAMGALAKGKLGRHYGFELPLVALSWRELMNVTTIALLLGENWSTLPALSFARESLLGLGSIVYDFPFLNSATEAQHIRLYTACLPFPSDSFIIASDADLFPVRKLWDLEGIHTDDLLYAPFRRMRNFPCKLPRKDAPEYLSMAYTGMSAARWRRTMALNQCHGQQDMVDLMHNYTASLMEENIPRCKKKHLVWYSDEVLLSAAVQLQHHAHPFARLWNTTLDPRTQRLWLKPPLMRGRQVPKTVSCEDVRSSHDIHMPYLPRVQGVLNDTLQCLFRDNPRALAWVRNYDQQWRLLSRAD
eukprot:RCo017788